MARHTDRSTQARVTVALMRRCWRNDRRRRLGRIAAWLGDLDENFVVLDHAQFEAGTLFNCTGAVFQVADLGRQLGVARLEFFIFLLGGDHLPVEIPGAQPSTLAQPQRILDQQQQGCEAEGYQAHRVDVACAAGNFRFRLAAILLSQIVKCATSRVACDVAQVFFDAQQLVVLCHTVGTGHRTCLDLQRVGTDGDIGNRRIFGLA
jgi:hypothetical protein